MEMLRTKPTSLEDYNIAYPAVYRYILNEPDKCREMSPFLILMIPVAPADHAARDAIRKTWGREGLIPGVIIWRIFYVGLPQGDRALRIQAALEKESREHRDIVQKDFLDSYRNLTIKTMMILDWLASYCPGASYVMKIDTDMFLNVDYLVNKVLDPRRVPPKQDFMTGRIINFGIIRRDPGSKWYMPLALYPGCFYPQYVSGVSYVFSTDLVPKILQASQSVRPIFLEDVYVGMCLQQLGIHPTYPPDSSSFSPFPTAYNRCRFLGYVSATLAQPEQLLQIWQDFQRAKFTCYEWQQGH
nr:PREDICTED: beta-1,3-galactosyltransferase 2-like [Lepisosteus oculatus]